MSKKEDIKKIISETKEAIKKVPETKGKSLRVDIIKTIKAMAYEKILLILERWTNEIYGIVSTGNSREQVYCL